MKVWITKYALTQGIFEEEAEDYGDGFVKVTKKGFLDSYYKKGKDWHKTKESAIAKAEEMREKKIASLKKQIEKLEKIKFE